MTAHVPTATKTALALAAMATFYSTNVAAPTAGLVKAQALGHRLAHHVRKVASVEHLTRHPGAPQDAAAYIEGALTAEGFEVKRQQYEYDGLQVRNLEVSLINTSNNQAPRRILIIGAHFDCVRGAPGANDNGSGMAAVLELARILKGIRLSQGTELKFLFFVNEEAPYLSGHGMVSRQHAKDSQRYRPGLEDQYPNKGNFIAFVGTLESAELVRKALAAFKAASSFPAEGLTSTSYVEGVTWSDHTSYNRHDSAAFMITDTAFLRYPYYHTARDTSDKLDYQGMARVVEGLAKVIVGIATPTGM